MPKPRSNPARAAKANEVRKVSEAVAVLAARARWAVVGVYDPRADEIVRKLADVADLTFELAQDTASGRVSLDLPDEERPLFREPAGVAESTSIIPDEIPTPAPTPPAVEDNDDSGLISALDLDSGGDVGLSDPAASDGDGPRPLSDLDLASGDYLVRCNHCGHVKHRGSAGGCPKGHTSGWSFHAREGTPTPPVEPEPVKARRKSRAKPCRDWAVFDASTGEDVGTVSAAFEQGAKLIATVQYPEIAEFRVELREAAPCPNN